MHTIYTCVQVSQFGDMTWILQWFLITIVYLYFTNIISLQFFLAKWDGKKFSFKLSYNFHIFLHIGKVGFIFKWMKNWKCLNFNNWSRTYSTFEIPPKCLSFLRQYHIHVNILEVKIFGYFCDNQDDLHVIFTIFMLTYSWHKNITEIMDSIVCYWKLSK